MTHSEGWYFEHQGQPIEPSPDDALLQFQPIHESYTLSPYDQERFMESWSRVSPILANLIQLRKSESEQARRIADSMLRSINMVVISMRRSRPERQHAMTIALESIIMPFDDQASNFNLQKRKRFGLWFEFLIREWEKDCRQYPPRTGLKDTGQEIYDRRSKFVHGAYLSPEEQVYAHSETLNRRIGELRLTCEALLQALKVVSEWAVNSLQSGQELTSENFNSRFKHNKTTGN